MELILKYFTSLSSKQIDHFRQLQALYLEWNQRINVISRKDIDALYLHHVLHSLAIACTVSLKSNACVLDVGTGGGFPAIPLAIMFPDSRFLAVDTVGKKIKVVNTIIDELNLNNIEAKQIQAVEVPGHFDFVVSRGVTQLSSLLSWIWPKIKNESVHALPNGVICLKGGDLKSEIDDAVKQMHLSRSQIDEYPIIKFFNEPYFETKKVLYIQH